MVAGRANAHRSLLLAVLLAILLARANSANPESPHGRALRGITATGPSDAGQTENENRNWLEDVLNTAENVFQHVFGLCNHGNYCGQSCNGNEFADPAWDDLDSACRNHDWCLDQAGDDLCSKCGCHQRLVDAAHEVDARDDDSRESGEAPSIVMGILGKMKMDGCPELGASAECSERARQLDYDNRDSVGPPGGLLGILMEGLQEAYLSDSECGAAMQSNVFLEPTPGATDRYQPVGNWDECCAVCYGDSECQAWSFSPENKKCDGGPCCFLRGSTGYTVISKPDEGLGLADRVSGVYSGTFPDVGTTV